MVDTDLLIRLFRSAHAIHGGAEFVGMESIEELAGALTDLFDFARNGDLVFSRELVMIAFQAVDHIKTIVNDPSSQPKETLQVAALLRKTVKEHLPERIQRSTTATIIPEGIPHGVRFSLSAYTLERKTRKGFFYIVTIRPDAYTAATGKTIIDISDTLRSLGEILDTVSVPAPDSPPVVHFFYHTLLTGDALRSSFPEIATEDITVTPISHEQLNTLVTVSEDVTPKERRKKEQHQTEGVLPATSSTIPKTIEDSGTPPSSSETTRITVPDEPFPEQEWDQCSEFVTFFLDKEIYAVPIFLVHDIKEMLPYSRLPNQPSSILGVINLRGNVVPIFDLRRIIGLPPRHFDRKTVLIVLDIGDKMNGIVVDAIRDVATIEPHTRQVTPLLGREVVADYARFIGTDPKSGSFLIVLDIEKAITKVLSSP